MTNRTFSDKHKPMSAKDETTAEIGSEFAAQDKVYMAKALESAREASKVGEVPVGAVIVLDGVVIARDFNQPIGTHDPSSHAEIRVLRAAGRFLKNYRLADCDLYVTVEPCTMCYGAIVHARIKRLVYGTPEPRFGAVERLVNIHNIEFNHRPEIIGGILELESRELMQDFFRTRRRRK